MSRINIGYQDQTEIRKLLFKVVNAETNKAARVSRPRFEKQQFIRPLKFSWETFGIYKAI